MLFTPTQNNASKSQNLKTMFWLLDTSTRAKTIIYASPVYFIYENTSRSVQGCGKLSRIGSKVYFKVTCVVAGD